jgi:hypothetical protein
LGPSKLQYIWGSHYSSDGTWYHKNWVSGVIIFTWNQNQWVSDITIINNKKLHTWHQKHWLSGVIIFTWYQNHWVPGYLIKTKKKASHLIQQPICIRCKYFHLIQKSLGVRCGIKLCQVLISIPNKIFKPNIKNPAYGRHWLSQPMW